MTSPLTKQYQLKLADGKLVVWEGSSPEEAIDRYLDHERCEKRFPTVVAWRHWPREGIFVGDHHIRIID